MRHSQLAALLEKTIPAKLPVLIKGAPGIGKTDIVLSAAKKANANVILSHPVVADPTDAKGLPWKLEGQNSATFLPFGELEQALNATQPTVWFLDDLGQATPATQASFMHLILAREVAGHKLPDCVTFIAATNRRQDKAGVSGILEPVKSRFATIVELEANLDDWLAWANAARIDPMICAFLMWKPAALHDFSATSDITNSPSPRTWVSAHKLLGLNLPLDLEQEALEGAIGKGAALEFMAFKDVYMQLPNVAEVLMSPSTAQIPDNPAGKYGICHALAHQVNPTTLGAMATYLERFSEREFLALGMQATVQRQPEVSRSPAFVQWATSPNGRALFGAQGF